MCELGWFRLDGYIIKPAFYTFAVADLGGGARRAVPPPPPPHLVSQDIQRDGCVVIKTHKNTLILANNVIFVHFNA